MPTRSRVARIGLQRYRVTYNKLSSSDRPYDTNEVSHKAEDESETAESKDAKDLDERSSSVNREHELFRKRQVKGEGTSALYSSRGNQSYLSRKDRLSISAKRRARRIISGGTVLRLIA